MRRKPKQGTGASAQAASPSPFAILKTAPFRQALYRPPVAPVKPPPPPPPSDEEVFRAEVRDVTPLPSHYRGRIEPLAQRPPPWPRQREADEHAALDESLSDPVGEVAVTLALEGGDAAAYVRLGVAANALRDLRRGRWVVQAQLDLHGHTRDAARFGLVEFLHEADRQDWRCVRIIHGKGLGSPRKQPVLKGLVQHWLAQRQEVLAFCQAPSHDGGAGALLVLLRAGRR